jgi:hypothetical protein
MNFFGFGRKKRRDGVAVFTELIDQVLYLASAVRSYSDMKRHLTETHEVLTASGDKQMLASTFLVFLEDSLKYGKTTRQLLGEMERDAVDFSGLEEVEYLLLLTIINALFMAQAVAKEIAAIPGPLQLEAVRSIYDNENDPRGESVRIILHSAALADRIRFQRSLRSPEYASDVLERQIRPEIPDTIAGPGAHAFRRIRSSR